MDAIVPPGNQNLIMDDNGSRRSYYPYCNDSIADVLDRISTASENVINNDNSNSHHQSATAERLGLAGIGATDRNGSETRGNTDRNGLEARQLVREEGHEVRDNLRHNRDAVERFGLKNLDSTKDGFKDLVVSMKDDLRDILISQKNDVKDLLLKNCQVEKDMLLQFKDAQLVAMQNKADLAAQIAECCCENKELIRAEAGETRQLMMKLDEQNLRDKLRKAEEELIALRLRSTLPPLPIAAVTV
jgi:hypothetical protein